MIKLKLFLPEHHPIVAQWWLAQKWPVVPLESLSEIGLIAYDDATNTDLAAGWLYIMTKYWALIEWIVVNPQAPLKQRKLGVELILDRLILEGQLLGAQAFFSSLKSNGMIRLYQKYGFRKGDTGMTNMVLECPSKPPIKEKLKCVSAL